MKRKIVISALAVTILVALILSGCGTFQQSPTALPTVMLDSGGTAKNTDATQPAQNEPARPFSGGTGDVIASGIVIPGEEAQVAFAMAAQVLDLNVKAGDTVQAGQVLARLAGSEKLAAAVEAANLELLAAQQALTDLNASAEQARAQAQLRVATARDVLDTAEKRRGWKEYRVGSDNSIDLARADLILAEDALKRAEEAFGSAASSENEDANKAAAMTTIAAARKVRDKAQANLNYLLSMPDEIEVGKVEAELQVAQAELNAAQAELAKWQNGPDPAQVALAEARIKNAEAQLAASKASLADLELKAPIAGTLIEVNIHQGEWAVPGQPVMMIADVTHLRVETTDLSERDVPKVFVGQEVTVFIEALNAEVDGTVAEIAPLADTLGGDVVYHTKIDLAGVSEDMRAGMSVEVRFK